MLRTGRQRNVEYGTGNNLKYSLDHPLDLPFVFRPCVMFFSPRVSDFFIMYRYICIIYYISTRFECYACRAGNDADLIHLSLVVTQCALWRQNKTINITVIIWCIYGIYIMLRRSRHGKKRSNSFAAKATIIYKIICVFYIGDCHYAIASSRAQRFGIIILFFNQILTLNYQYIMLYRWPRLKDV
jgi:hypothetical protein